MFNKQPLSGLKPAPQDDSFTAPFIRKSHLLLRYGTCAFGRPQRNVTPCLNWVRTQPIAAWHMIGTSIASFLSLTQSKIASHLRWLTEMLFPMHRKEIDKSITLPRKICSHPSRHLRLLVVGFL